MDEELAPIGVRLREARMRQGLDLADCAAATRIRERYLIAIEDGRFESLPGPAYVSGFVRAYAAHLGVAVDGPVKELPVAGSPSPAGGRSAVRPVTVTATRITPRGVGQRPRWRRPLAIIVLLAVVVVVLVVVAGVGLPLVG
ncbi:MAG TPA: helix-turn-helix transcriptional regulator [Miltoncostaeaceae bacterium]|nr:helix-turn-helix transcriptional regulator [Miltoncostaeaceae bacterium]